MEVLNADPDFIGTIDRLHVTENQQIDATFRKFIVKPVDNHNLSSASSIVLSFFLNITAPHQRELVYQWEQKVRAVKITNLYPQYFGVRSPNEGDDNSHSVLHYFSLLEEFSWNAREYYEVRCISTNRILFLVYE